MRKANPKWYTTVSVVSIFLPILNTADIVDAIYGTIGVFISFIYLYFISKYGFEEVA